MKRGRLVGALALLTGASLVALFVAGPGPITDNDRAEELLFPHLMESINDITRLTTRHEGRELGAERVDGTWVVPQRGGYRASEAAVRKIILAMADIRKLEAMTRKPQRYQKLGLEPPDNEDAYSVQIQLSDASGKSLGAVVLGHRDPSKVDENSNEIYVRALDDPQTWLVEADVPHATDPKDLLDTQVSELDLERVREVRIKHVDGHRISIEKSTPTDVNFTLKNMPNGTEVIYDWAVNDLGRAFTGLQLIDVKSLDDADFSDPLFELELETFDGLVLRMESKVGSSGHLVRLRAALAEDTPEPSQHESLLSAEVVRQEVDSRNALWQGWAYQFTDYRYGTFSTPMSQLVQSIGTASE